MSDIDSGTLVFLLIWKGTVVRIYSHKKDVEHKGDDGKTKHNVRYMVRQIGVPEILKTDIPSIKVAIKEALISFGWNASTEYTGETIADDLDDTEVIFSEILESNLFVGE